MAKSGFTELTDRQKEILTAIIEDFIATAEPVGSRTLTKRKAITLSPATVRNAMADLEELGLLSAAHASAGRVPTTTAFRLYVEQLAQRGRISARERELIQAIAVGEPSEQGDIFGVLREAGQILSSVSKHAALVLMPTLDDVIFAQIEFMPIRENAVLAVFVAKSGFLQHRVLEVEVAMERDELTRMSNYLNSMLTGKTLVDVRADILRAMANERAQADNMMRQALLLGERTLRVSTNQDLLLEGERTFLDHPEFADIAKMRKLLRAFEEKTLLLHLLDAASVAPVEANAAAYSQTAVLFGADSTVRDLRDLAAVTASYSSSDGSGGRVAIVGPTRMNYARLIPLVELTADALTQTLSPDESSKDNSGDGH
ncbi:MAG: heat-inducible transcriptional repressor HrcA [Myxococcota bacterium]